MRAQALRLRHGQLPEFVLGDQPAFTQQCAVYTGKGAVKGTYYLYVQTICQ
jgi:hypothetical protein